jgi:hypothetical protein
VAAHKGCPIREAAAAAGVRRRDVKALIRGEAEFAEDYATARGRGVEQIHAQMVKLAIEGVDEPLVSMGQIVGTKKVYSERLLQTMFNALTPEGRATLGNKLGIEINTGGGDVKLQEGVALADTAAFMREHVPGFQACSRVSRPARSSLRRTSLLAKSTPQYLADEFQAARPLLAEPPDSVEAAGGVSADRPARGVLRWRRRRRQVGCAARRGARVRRHGRLQRPDPPQDVRAAEPAGRDHVALERVADVERRALERRLEDVDVPVDRDPDVRPRRALQRRLPLPGLGVPVRRLGRADAVRREDVRVPVLAYAPVEVDAGARHPDPAPGRVEPGRHRSRLGQARFIEEKTRDKRAVYIPAKVYDNPGLDVDEYRESLAMLDETLRAQLLDGDWGVFEGAAFTITNDHAIDSFELSDSINRFEALDYGLNGAPWALWAIDYEGNLVVVDMRYWHDKLPSDITPEIIELRKREWGLRNVCYADPSIWHRTGQKNKWGAPAMLADEFSDNGVPLEEANNDPRAGLIRLRDLLKLDPEHPFPSWHPRAGEKGAPRMFIVRRSCERLLEELAAAPLRPGDKLNAGEIIDPEWEGPNGHAVAMARYAVMSKPAASVEPEKSLREELLEPEGELDRRGELLKQHIRNVQRKQPWRRLLAHD